MNLLLLLLAAAAAFLVIRALGRSGGGSGAEEDDDDPPSRVHALCAELTGDPRRDRPLQNRLLSLGPGVIPMVLEHLGEMLKSPDGYRPAVMARLEELVADFGLAALPALAVVLSRIQPASPMAPSMWRILRRLGPPGALGLLRIAIEHGHLHHFLPRLRLTDARRPRPGDALFTVLREREPTARLETLEALAGLLADHPEVLIRLSTEWDAEGRALLLTWLGSWLPLATPELVVAGLADASAPVRRAAARLAVLLAERVPIPALAEHHTDPDPVVRATVARALGVAPGALAVAALSEALADPEPEVALAAFIALLRHGNEPPPVLAAIPALQADPRRVWLEAGLRGEAESLLIVLEEPDPDRRAPAVRMLGRCLSTDPRAKERLIRMAEDRDSRDRAEAVLTLALAREPNTADLLARAVRELPSDDTLLALQETAQVLGEAAAIPLARRVRGDVPGGVEGLLAVLRAVPYAGAMAPLLRGLEATRGPAEALIEATLHVAGAPMREGVVASIRQPGRGLLAPALTWLAVYAAPADLPLLLDLFDRHVPMRNPALNLIEGMGEPGQEALRARLLRGGDDGVLLAIEQRVERLRAGLEQRE